MAVKPVNVYVENVATHQPLLGVVVGVYDPTTFAELGLTLTSPQGMAAFQLEPGVYEVRCSKLMTRFANPFRIEVTDLGPNGFLIPATALSIPAATDPRCCRVSGRFMGLNNQPIAGATVRFSSKASIDSTKQGGPGTEDLESNTKMPVGVDGNFIAAQGYNTQSDVNGFVSVDLIRGAELYVTFSGEDDQLWKFTVPDQASANLFDLIYPKPLDLIWNQLDAPGNAVNLNVGNGWEVLYDVEFSDHKERTSGLSCWLEFKSDNTDVCLVEDVDGKVVLAAVGAGTAHITVALKPGLHPLQMPEPVLAYTNLTVTVTP